MVSPRSTWSVAVPRRTACSSPTGMAITSASTVDTPVSTSVRGRLAVSSEVTLTLSRAENPRLPSTTRRSQVRYPDRKVSCAELRPSEAAAGLPGARLSSPNTISVTISSTTTACSPRRDTYAVTTLPCPFRCDGGSLPVEPHFRRDHECRVLHADIEALDGLGQHGPDRHVHDRKLARQVVLPLVHRLAERIWCARVERGSDIGVVGLIGEAASVVRRVRLEQR